MTVLVGTSGWQYRDWHGAFYPRELAQRLWLDHYAARFATVEINTSFYRLPPTERFTAWAATTPADFVLCPKVSRYLSHMKKLQNPHEPVERFVTAVGGLGAKLGPVLLQLPGTFRRQLHRLDAALAQFPADVRVAVELRHPSWFTDDTRRLLTRRGAALCVADRGSVELTPPWRTTEWGYVRFHEGRGVWPCYGRTALASRARMLADRYGADAEIYAFFNNDPRACAVRDARWFAAACRRAGLATTRVPAARDVRLVEPGQRSSCRSPRVPSSGSRLSAATKGRP